MKWIIRQILFKTPNNNFLLLSDFKREVKIKITKDIRILSEELIDRYNYEAYNEHIDFTVRESKKFANIIIYFNKEQEDIYKNYLETFRKDLKNNFRNYMEIKLESFSLSKGN